MLQIQSKKPHPSSQEMVEKNMHTHANRMDIVRLHQRAEDAETEMRQAQLIASMEAREQEKLRQQLGLARQEIDAQRREKREFFAKLSQLLEMESAAGSLGEASLHVTQRWREARKQISNLPIRLRCPPPLLTQKI